MPQCSSIWSFNLTHRSSASHCGTCTACLDACPTQAFPQTFVMDASRCISYLTIELRSEIPVELREPIGDWVFGCDICQDVCPWNRKESPGPIGFPHAPDLEWLDPLELLSLDADAFRRRFKKTSLFRTRRAGLLRNAAIVLGNIGDERALPALEKALTDPEELIREAVKWAVGRIPSNAFQIDESESLISLHQDVKRNDFSETLPNVTNPMPFRVATYPRLAHGGK